MRIVVSSVYACKTEHLLLHSMIVSAGCLCIGLSSLVALSLTRSLVKATNFYTLHTPIHSKYDYKCAKLSLPLNEPNRWGKKNCTIELRLCTRNIVKGKKKTGTQAKKAGEQNETRNIIHTDDNDDDDVCKHRNTCGFYYIHFSIFAREAVLVAVFSEREKYKTIITFAAKDFEPSRQSNGILDGG